MRYLSILILLLFPFVVSAQDWDQLGGEKIGISNTSKTRIQALSGNGKVLGMAGVGDGILVAEWDGSDWKDRPLIAYNPAPPQNGIYYNTIALDDLGRNVVFSNSRKSAQVFEWNGNAWSPRGNTITLVNPLEEIRSVDVTGDGGTIAISTVYYNNDPNGQHYFGGRAYIYTWDGIAWQLKGSSVLITVNPDDSQILMKVELSSIGDRFALAISNLGGLGPVTYAQVFQWNGIGWAQLGSQIFHPNSLLPSSGFYRVRGMSFSSNGNSVAIAWTSPSDIGNATVHTFDEVNWQQSGKTFEGLGSENNLAWAVSLSNNILAINSLNKSVTGIRSDTGLVETFYWDGACWIPFGETLLGDAKTHYFGSNISLSADGKVLSSLATPYPAQINRHSYTRVYSNCLSFHNEFITTCDSFTWRNGRTYFSSTNKEKDTLTNSEGCDSIITLNLTIRKHVDTTINEESCDSFTWINGVTYYNDADTPTFLLKTIYGCDSLVHLNLTVNKTPSLEPFSDTTVCFGDSIFLKAITNSTDVLWSTGIGSADLWAKRGNYTFIAKNGNCTISDSIQVNELAPISVALKDQFYICEKENELVKLDAGKGFFNYLWYPTNDTTQWIEVGKVGDYYVVVNDYRGCQGDKGTKVDRRCDVTYFIPDAFTPNGDGVNDFFTIKGDGIEKVHLQIFDRWGGKIYEGTDIKGWNGANYPEGVYLFLLKVEGFKQKEPIIYNESGSVTLLR